MFYLTISKRRSPHPEMMHVSRSLCVLILFEIVQRNHHRECFSPRWSVCGVYWQNVVKTRLGCDSLRLKMLAALHHH